MTTSDRAFNHSFLVVTGLTALLFLAGIVLLPGIGTYTDEVQAQTTPAETLNNGPCFIGVVTANGVLEKVQIHQP